MSNQDRNVSRGGNRSLLVALVIVGLLSLAALVAMTVKAWNMVQVGKGTETYRTFWLVEGDWLGFLVFIAALIFALVFGLLLRWWQLRREWRD
jgi:hypothetical protein